MSTLADATDEEVMEEAKERIRRFGSLQGFKLFEEGERVRVAHAVREGLSGVEAVLGRMRAAKAEVAK